MGSLCCESVSSFQHCSTSKALTELKGFLTDLLTFFLLLKQERMLYLRAENNTTGVLS